MHIGQWLIADDSILKVFSPWFPRGGDNAVFTYQKIYSVGSPTFDVAVVHKSLDDTGNGTEATAAVAWAQIASSGIWTGRFDDLKELVRFQLELTSTGEGAEMLLYRMLAPTWFNDAQ